MDESGEGGMLATELSEELIVAGGIGRGRDILRRVASEELVTELRDWLVTAKEEQARFKSEANDRGKVLRGKLFELLTEAEFGGGLKVNGELIQLMHDPDQFKMTFGNKKNPDAATIEIDTQRHLLVITAVGEAKLNWLNERAFRQVKAEGFIHTLEVATEAINKMTIEEIREHGLVNLADELKRIGAYEGASLTNRKIEKAGDIRVDIMVPAEKDLRFMDKFRMMDEEELRKNVGLLGAVVDLGDFTAEELFTLAKMVRGGKLVFLNSSFGSKEVGVMADLIMKKIDAVS